MVLLSCSSPTLPSQYLVFPHVHLEGEPNSMIFLAVMVLKRQATMQAVMWQHHHSLSSRTWQEM